MRLSPLNSKTLATLMTLFMVLSLGCARLQLPQIDPLGRSVFLPQPNSTTILSPFQSRPQTMPPVLPTIRPPAAQTPAFQSPPPVAPCPTGNCGARLGSPHIQANGQLISHQRRSRVFSRQQGSLVVTPSRIVAPVGSEVVVLAGICGEDGFYIVNQPVEWMLSRDSVGNIVEVGGMEHDLFNRLIPPSSKKFDGEYAWGRTALKEKLITRGTDTPCDDLRVQKGQAWLSLSSASQGTSYLTCVAPKTEAWPERKRNITIHWVDGVWSIPMPSSATAGSIHQLNTVVNRTSDGSGVAGWKVRYQIAGGVPAEFHPQGTQTAEVTTNSQGQAPIQLRQPAGAAVAGQTQVRVEIVRPGFAGERELVLESGITTVQWSSPALTIRAIGPKSAGVNQAFNYRLEITNPGDQIARDVVVSTSEIEGQATFISSNPKPAQYGQRYEWKLGDIAPGPQPKVIDIQLRSDQRGPLRICYQVESQSDQIETEACAETEIVVPCIGLKINGPTQVRAGESFNYTFDITNQCERPLENVMVTLQHDAGLQAFGPSGQQISNPIEIGPLGQIRPGETKNLPALTFRALQGGSHCFNLEVRSAANDTARARKCIQAENVIEPKVQGRFAGATGSSCWRTFLSSNDDHQRGQRSAGRCFGSQ